MANGTSSPSSTIRPLQHRDLDRLGQVSETLLEAGDPIDSQETAEQLDHLRRWYGPLKFLSLFPNPLQHLLGAFVAEKAGEILGLIQVSPFNRTRSTWRVERIAVNRGAKGGAMFGEVGSSLLRYCFEKIWEARTWLIEVNVNNKAAIALYRQNGFQPLAQVTYWALPPELLAELAEREPDLPNLLPVSNADAQLLYQLDTASMPPLVRQVFDHQIQDFKTGVLQSVGRNVTRWVSRSETISAYVFEPQRKAAIGHFSVTVSREADQPHEAEFTVHPAYTWLYPELLAQMARVLQGGPERSLRLASVDYQPEREEYLNRIGAVRMDHSLMMSRSVWHKLRESKPVSLEGLQLADVLPGLQSGGKAVPGRMSWLSDIPSRKDTPDAPKFSPIHKQPGQPSEGTSPDPGDETAN